jgi:two-component system, NtrC family, response regulator HydG
MKKILIIDDDIDMCSLLKHFLIRKGYDVIVKYSATEGLEFLAHTTPDLIISDLMLGDIDGIELLKKVKANNTNLPFIIISAYEDIATSVKAISHGAFNYVTKPILPEEIYTLVQQALEIKEKNDKNISKGSFIYPNPKESILTVTESWKRILKQINLVAPTNHNIIIYGEGGSGKKTVGRKIHELSEKSAMPFLAVNCNTLPKTPVDILEWVEAANGGTLFLENVTGLSLADQRFLLGILKEKKIKASQSNKPIELSLRIIASSDEIVWNGVVAGRFMEGLFHYINGFNIETPSLQNKKDDIMLFANHFLQLANLKFEKYLKGFTPEAATILKTYTWPGNLRELNNIITKAVLLNSNNTLLISAEVFPEEIKYFNKGLIANKDSLTSNVPQKEN